ncbi:MAG TPA: hypothetical protein PKM17_00895, partial [Syntrophorhabdus sp.]|nr:hypothetical protein [Syntrophorhabdus sp.]
EITAYAEEVAGIKCETVDLSVVEMNSVRAADQKASALMEEAIVRANKKVSTPPYYDRFSVTSNRWVNDCHMDSPFFKIRVILLDDKGSFPNILRIDLMGNVHKSYIRKNREDCTFHDTDVGVL